RGGRGDIRRRPVSAAGRPRTGPGRRDVGREGRDEAAGGGAGVRVAAAGGGQDLPVRGRRPVDGERPGEGRVADRGRQGRRDGGGGLHRGGRGERQGMASVSLTGVKIARLQGAGRG